MKCAIVAIVALAATALAGDVGILYEVWHSMAATAMREVEQRGGLQLTTELVIQSSGNRTLDDVFKPTNVTICGDIWNVQPQLGFYCLYRARPGDPTPPIPDCPNITATATAHARMLTDARVDYVAVDITNWPQVNPGTDVAVLRPTEVLFEEWAALRASGVPTPSIAVWPCSPQGSTTWQYLLDHLYNNASYEGLVYTQAGKKVMFIPDTSKCYDNATVALIESNGGRNDVSVILMWAMMGPAEYSNGVWGFFSFCTDGAGDDTTSIVGMPPCNQPVTTDNNSSSIVEISASGGYMMAQCALPFGSPGHFRGLTIARLFEKILALQPPHVFLSSFNEHIGGRQAPEFPSKIAFNQGLPHDPQAKQVWVDTYASEFSRDIEPSVEAGNSTFIVASSCIRMYKAGLTCSASPTEPCCTRMDKEVFGNIWSLARKDGSDYLLTQLAGERAALLAGGAWREQCHPIPAPTAFCVSTSEPDGRSGPFVLYNTSGVGARGTPTRALYRCMTSVSPGQHFFSIDPACEDLGHLESTLGYISTKPGLETLRALRRCKGAQGTRFHALDLQCDIPDGDGAPLGYVR